MISAARAAAIFILVLATSAMPALRGGAQADSSPDTVEITFWNSIQSSTDPADFQAYLDKYPHGYFADLANNRIRRLTKPAAANAPNPAPAPEAAPQTEPKATAQPEPAPAVEFTGVSRNLYARSGARLRAQPNRDAAVLSRVAVNTVLPADGRSTDGKWWRVGLADGKTGYIAAGAVSDRAVKVAAPPPAPAPVAAAPKPTGPDADVCNPGSGAAANYREEACARALAAATDDRQRTAFLTFMGDAQDEQRHYDMALSSYRKAADLDPQNFKIYYAMGIVRQHQRRYPEARAAFEKAALVHPDDPDTLFQRGVSVAALGDFDAGKLDVKRAIGLKDDAGYYAELAKIELARQNFDGAKTAVERALKLDPGYGSPSLAMADYFNGALDPAVEQIGRSEGKPAADFRVALWKALILRAKGNTAGADQALEAGAGALGTAQWPAPLFDFMRGKISEDKLRLAGKSGAPREQAEKLCQIDFYIGETAFLAGNKDGARKALRDAVGTRIFYYPEYVAANARLARMNP
jgi:tetratricopeptide (TPR) repeat protein